MSQITNELATTNPETETSDLLPHLLNNIPELEDIIELDDEDSIYEDDILLDDVIADEDDESKAGKGAKSRRRTQTKKALHRRFNSSLSPRNRSDSIIKGG
jgi:RNA polymerase primary sigma factor